MHEMSLVTSLFEQLDALAEEHQAERILSVEVEIGPLSGVVVDSFSFAFSVLAAERPLAREARLVVLSPEVGYRCLDCQGLMAAQAKKPRQCDKCKSSLLYPEGGDQLLLRRVELE